MRSRARRTFWMQLLPLLIGFAILAAIIGARTWLIEVQRQDGLAVIAAAQFDRRLMEIFDVLQNAESGQRGYLLTGEPAYLEPMREALRILPEQVGVVRAAIEPTPRHHAQFERMNQLLERRVADLQSVTVLYQQGRAAEAISVVRSDEGRRTMQQIRSIIDEIRRVEAGVLQTRLDSSLAANRWLSIASGVSLVLIVAVAAVTILGTRRRILEIVAARDQIAAANTALAAEIEAKAAAEAQLRQMQKMEAVGQLTGGIAHDFNNMLAVIISSMNLLQRKLARGETDLQKFVDAAMDAAGRAASLTGRLLAFSRQQALKPQVIDANRLIAGMSELLARTLGEPIRIETVLAGGLWRCHADASQLENAVVNLAVNARDAMPDGGRLTIETANCHLDERYSASHNGVPAGQYVLIAVSDTGEGMSAEVQDRAFDPFFTTKPVGKGTGLGLSQVFGFVRQSGGHVKIYSEVGQGTTVKIYLPRWFGEETGPEAATPATNVRGSSGEIVLVVEDDERVRALSVEALRELGYTVLHARDGEEALRRVETTEGLALLFTDIVMPGMDGRKLADEALRRRPGLKVLFTTGFTRNAVVHNGVLDHGVDFLAKPFTVDQLAAKVRQVLDAVG